MMSTKQQKRKNDIQAFAEINGVGWTAGPDEDEDEDGLEEDEEEEDEALGSRDEEEEDFSALEEEEEALAADGSDGMTNEGWNRKGAWGRVTSSASKVRAVRKNESGVMNGFGSCSTSWIRREMVVEDWDLAE
jgi:hypothetical protein